LGGGTHPTKSWPGSVTISEDGTNSAANTESQLSVVESQQLTKSGRDLKRHQPSRQDQIDGLRTLLSTGSRVRPCLSASAFDLPCQTTPKIVAVKVNQRPGSHRFGLDVKVGGVARDQQPSFKIGRIRARLIKFSFVRLIKFAPGRFYPLFEEFRDEFVSYNLRTLVYLVIYDSG